MIGKIIIVPGPGGAPGFLAANHGRNFSFTSAGWQAPSVVPTVGRQVEFEPRAAHAVNVRPTGPFHGRQSAPGPAAGQAQRQPKPPRTATPQHRSNRSHGSMLAALRSMLSIFIITPFSVPLLVLLPLFGRLELVSVVLLAGFFGGRRAGGFGKALAAAVLAGAAHGFVIYLMTLVGLQLMMGLPHVGGYVDAGIGFFGGLTVASSLVTVVVALPAFLILLFSAVIGAMTVRAKP